MRIALAGNPNSGKTTMFNVLTGSNEKTGNWTGVTVDRIEKTLKKTYGKKAVVVDLPGTYSMSPFSSEEGVTSSYIKSANIDVIVNIIDATNLERSLFLTTQLLELEIPMVVALNKCDVNEKNGKSIDENLLSKTLGCPVIKTISTSNKGIEELVDSCFSLKEQRPELYAGHFADDMARTQFIKDIVAEVEQKQDTPKNSIMDKIDEKLTHPIIGLLVFATVMFGVFYISQAEGPIGIGKFLEGILTGWIEQFQEFVSTSLEGANPLLHSILVDGIIGGVGAVVGFLPLVMVMYFLLALLEDCGYMARATVVLDPIFKKVGLSGKSAIPMIIGTGCGIPAIMACRTIRDERERRATAILSTFMPCGAKLPVIALFAGAFFPDATWVGPLMYFCGIVLILLGSLLIKIVTGMNHAKSFFIIELPDYKTPSLKIATKSMLERGKAYIIKAGTVILVCNTVVQIMQSFDMHFNLVDDDMVHTSILATIASPFAYLLVPVVGVFAWQLAAAAITGFIAKENVVGTLATVYALTSFIDTEELALIGDGQTVGAVMGLTKVAALAYLMFNLFTPPCFAAIGAMNAELRSGKWLLGAIGLQLSTGFTVGFLVYQIGTLITIGSLGNGFLGGFVAICIIIGVITYLGHKNSKRLS